MAPPMANNCTSLLRRLRCRDCAPAVMGTAEPSPTSLAGPGDSALTSCIADFSIVVSVIRCKVERSTKLCVDE